MLHNMGPLILAGGNVFKFGTNINLGFKYKLIGFVCDISKHTFCLGNVIYQEYLNGILSNLAHMSI